MPLYEYACHQCGKHFDVLQKFSDQPLAVHEECGGEVERLISAPALQFKGTGWYVTDYARKDTVNAPNSNGKSEAKGDSKADSKGESQKDSKTESKSESKSESKGETKTESKSAPSTPAT
jgi:putative FmdB family regulatory protein